MATLEELLVRIEADTERMRRELKRGERGVDGFEKKTKRKLNSIDRAFKRVNTAAGVLGITLGTGAFVAGVGRAVSDLSALSDTASKLGVSSERLQVWRFQAEQMAGVDFRPADMGLQRLLRRAGDAARGIGESEKIFEELGVTVTDVDGRMRSAEDIIADTADAIAKMDSEAEQLSATVKLVDSEAAGLAAVFRAGADGMDDMERAARSLGLILEEDLINRADKLDKEYRRVMTGLENRFQQFAVNLADAFSPSRRFIGGQSVAGMSLDEQIDALKKETESFQKRLDELPAGGGLFGVRQRSNLQRGIAQNQIDLAGLVRQRDARDRSTEPPADRNFETEAAKVQDFLDDIHRRHLAATEQNVRLARFEATERLAELQKFRDEGLLTEQAFQTARVQLEETTAAAISRIRDKEQRELEQALERNAREMRMFTGDLIVGLADAAVGFRNLKDVALDFLDSIRRSLLEDAGGFAAKLLTNFLTSAITGAVGGGTGGNRAPAGTGIGKTPGVEVRALPALAGGGRISGPSIVGEEGPEIFAPDTPGRIINATDTNKILSAGGGTVFQQIINLTPTAEEAANAAVLRFAPTLMEAAKQGVMDTKRRGGAASSVF